MKAIAFILATATIMSAAMTAFIYGNKVVRILGLILMICILIDLIYLALMWKGD